MSSVKTERQDEAEIIELAAKIADANKAKMSANAARLPQNSVTNVGGQMNILNYLNRKNNGKPIEGAAAAPNEESKRSGDEDSQKGKFGWGTLGKCHIPYIFRAGEKYYAVRMVELKVLNKYLNYLHQDIYSCTCIRSYYISEPESRLLNEINMKHCDYQFGRDLFSTRDLIVRMNDALEFYNFLDTCYTKLIQSSCNSQDRCGFIRINKESVVPYTICNGEKYVPLFYFEGETENLKLKADKLEGWDLSYLKFCCKVQGIRNELFAHETCAVISLNAIKSYFPPGTDFEVYWPSKVAESQLLIAGKNQTQVGQWTRQPPAPPSPQKAVPLPQTKTPLSPQVQAMYTNYGLVGGQPAFQMSQPRTGQSAVRTYHTQAATSGSRGTRPAYSYQPMAVAPPPLVRASQTSIIHGPGVYQGPISHPHYGVCLNDIPTVQNTYSRPGPPTPTNIPKYPPPLIPVRVLNGARYDQTQFPSSDVVDLSSSARGQQARMQQQQQLQQQQQQQQHQQANHNNTVQNPTRSPSVSSMSNGRVDGMGGTANTDHHNMKKLIPLADTPTSGSHIPYKIQKALVDGKMIPCINMKPYVYTELLVTLQDLADHFFNNMTVERCKQVMTVLRIDLYLGNRTQMQILVESGKCQSVNECVPLVQVRDVIDYMPQLKYMLSGIINDQLVATIQRSS